DSARAGTLYAVEAPRPADPGKPLPVPGAAVAAVLCAVVLAADGPAAPAPAAILGATRRPHGYPAVAGIGPAPRRNRRAGPLAGLPHPTPAPFRDAPAPVAA